MSPNDVEIRAQPGRQESFLASSADIAIFGGAAGGGKTWALLFEPLRHISNGDFGAVFFRRTYPEITIEAGPWDESMKLYPLAGAEPRLGRLEWRFPSKARVSFRHLQREDDKLSYQGAQIPLILFDQLERFSKAAFFYMLSRNRSMCGVKPYIRASCNPDPDSWLREFIGWWIADDGYADLSKEGKLRWFVRGGDEQLAWADTREELIEKYPKLLPKSATFIPASVYDNKILMAKNPEYLANLQALPLVDRLRLLGDARRGGNWNIREEAGKLFNRHWFEVVDAVPGGGIICRFWDFAATVKKMKGDDPDYTAGVKLLKVKGVYYFLDSLAVRKESIDRLFKNVSLQDAQQAKDAGARYMVRWEIEPGSAGKREVRRLAKLVPQLDAKGVRPSGDKVVRAKPLAAQSEVGNVFLLRGPWNEAWLTHMHNQPEIAHDDIMDGSSGAYNALATAGGVWRG